MKTYPDMKITGRITQGNTTAGYIVVDTTGSSKNLRKSRVIELARQGKFINASAYQQNDEWHLKGENGENLLQLPIHRMKATQNTKQPSRTKINTNSKAVRQRQIAYN